MATSAKSSCAAPGPREHANVICRTRWYLPRTSEGLRTAIRGDAASSREPGHPVNSHAPGSLLGEVPVRLYRYEARLRPRWAARIDLPDLGTPEAYGATAAEALRELAAKLTIEDLGQLREHCTP
jgi:hypothetical protein